MRPSLLLLAVLPALAGARSYAPQPNDPPPASPSFSYSAQGADWPSRHCKNGLAQSPINVVHAQPDTLKNAPSGDNAPDGSGDPAALEAPLKALAFAYRSSAVSLENAGGHLPRIHFERGSFVTFPPSLANDDDDKGQGGEEGVDGDDADDGKGNKGAGNSYELLYVDVHTPAEHQVRGLEFPLEFSLVHRDQRTGALATVNVLAREGDRSHALGSVAAAFPEAAGAKRPVKTLLSPLDFLPPGVRSGKENGYYTYEGSLTAPPCDAGARVFVMEAFAHVSRAQAADLRARFGANARAVQASNGRRPREFKGDAAIVDK